MDPFGLNYRAGARPTGRLLALLCGLVLLAPTALAQLPTGTLPSTVLGGAADRPATASVLALEGALDPAAYIVGPGDAFVVVLGGSRPRQLAATVTADGLLVIPEVGSFQAAGLTLATVRSRVQASLRRRYANVGTDIALAAPRQFYVHVSGAVPSPGRHLMVPVARVGDALAVATGVAVGGGNVLAALRPELVPDAPEPAEGTPPQAAVAPLLPSAPRPALRNVLVTHRDGTTERVDLLRYFATGDTRHNPYLLDGDAVYLPVFEPAAEGVYVGGAVRAPGVYDHRPADAVEDVVEAAGGVLAASGTSAVRLVAPGTAPQQTTSDAGTPVPVRSQVSVVPGDPLAGTAEAVGYVLYPGVYPIVAGTSTLRDLVAQAGGLRPEALARAAYLERRAPLDPTGEEPGPSEPATTTRAEQIDIATAEQAGLSDLGFLSRRFATQEAVRTARVSIALEDALAPGAPDVALQDGDRLVVPRGFDAVRVFGQVVRTGYVPFVAGQSAGYYVDAAGGTGPGATDVYVVEAGTGRYRALDAGGTVEPGDAVFVDRTPLADTPELQRIAAEIERLQVEERRADREEARDRRTATFQIVGAILSAAGLALTAIIALTR